MVQSPSWEANWFAASQEIPRISRNPKVHYRTHKRLPPVSILGQPNPVHIPTSHLLEIHPNIIHPSMPRSPQWSLFLRWNTLAVKITYETTKLNAKDIMVIETVVTSYSTNLHIQRKCALEHHLKWLFLDRITFHIHTFILRKIICGSKFMKEPEYFVTVLNLMNLESFLHACTQAHARTHTHMCIWLSYTWKWHEHVKNILETNINLLNAFMLELEAVLF